LRFDPSVPGEVVVDIDVFFLRHTFLVCFGGVGGVGDGSLVVGLWTSKSSPTGFAGGA